MDVSTLTLYISLASIALSSLTVAHAWRQRLAWKAAEVAAETERTFAAIETAKRDFEAFDARARRGA
jgi:hypothetical protein